MTVSFYRQIVWLVDTIRSAGKITKKELDARWAKSPLNTEGEKEYPLRTFHRHRAHIQDFFGLYIGCDKTTFEYYISESSDYREGAFRLRMCNMLSFSTQLLESPELQRRILFEVQPDGAAYLPTLLEAMREKRAVMVNFLPELGYLPMLLVPYFVKQHNHVWYLAAKQLDSEEEARVYDLSTVATIGICKQKASMPRWFSADAIFEDYFSAHDAKQNEQAVSVAKPKKAAKPKNASIPQPESAQLSLF